MQRRGALWRYVLLPFSPQVQRTDSAPHTLSPHLTASHIIDPQEGPPRAWTHPCNCTLVAHESCLLQWIKAAQQNPDRAPNALKCPQCGAKYELESKNPLMLRVLDAWNKALLRVGRLTTVSCAGIIVISFGAGAFDLTIITSNIVGLTKASCLSGLSTVLNRSLCRFDIVRSLGIAKLHRQ